MDNFLQLDTVGLWIVIVLYLFLPLTAITYYFFRRPRRRCEIERIFRILPIFPECKKGYKEEKFGRFFVLAILYSSVISLIGLTLIFSGSDGGYAEFPSVILTETDTVTVEFPMAGSRLMFSMAFLGAYLWGLQHVFRRYSMNDLSPGVYYTLSIRMILAAIIALLIFNTYTALAGSNNAEGGITQNVWPVLSFMIGMFPQRGLRWLMTRLPVFSQDTHPAARERPLEMIEGITIHDRLRLEEEGIDTCYDLASSDFIPLMLNTPYGARELLDWILQAKFCVFFGDAVKDLRQHNYRNIIDLKDLEDDDDRIRELAINTAATESDLNRAIASLGTDMELKLLLYAVSELSRFTKTNLEDVPTSDSNEDA